MVRLLVKAGANVNKPGLEGATPLSIAAYRGYTEMVRIFIEGNAYLDETFDKGATPLIMATIKGHTDIVKDLINAGAKFDKAMIQGITPLIYAAKKGHIDIVKALIDAGANINAKTDKGETTHSVAPEGGYTDIVRALLNPGSERNIENNTGRNSPATSRSVSHTDSGQTLKTHKSDSWIENKLLRKKNLINKPGTNKMEDRRELNSRQRLWARSTAQALAKTRITPNQISILSVLAAMLAMLAFFYSPTHPYLLLAAAFFIQMRLLCNLFDGMVAIEYNKKSSTGGIYNDLPDRFADLFIILGLSLAIPHNYYAIHLGWIAVILSLMTAYIRVLGRSLGASSCFSGPMAKQQRMFVCTAAALLQYFFLWFNIPFPVLYLALYIIIIGAGVTCCHRLMKITRALRVGT